MLSLNRTMKFVRCSKNEYLLRIGSMSNYSFNVKDENKQGILEYLFEDVEYPVEREKLVSMLVSKFEDSDNEMANETLVHLSELEILYDIDERNSKKKEVFLLSDRQCADIVRDKFKAQNYEIDFVILADGKSSETEHNIIEQGQEQLAAAIDQQEYVVLILSDFSPSLFYEANRVCLDENKKLLIAYMDGREGVIIPLLNSAQVGCYNDFEILRESSFYNLVDYQMMKEQAIRGKYEGIDHNPLYLSSLVDYLLLLFNHYLERTSINYYAYSLDFERLIFTKTRLFKFPKCPSCQGDRNLVHPFI